ncbi:MAG: hypothetical protein R3E82_07340 [Pseudomonadales bacterium]
MNTPVRLRLLMVLFLPAVLAPATVRADEQLVFGSFQNPDNAENWATRVGALLNAPISVATVTDAGVLWYRVVSPVLADADAARLKRLAALQQLRHWQITGLDPAGRLEQRTMDRVAGTASAPAPSPASAESAASDESAALENAAENAAASTSAAAASSAAVTPPVAAQRQPIAQGPERIQPPARPSEIYGEPGEQRTATAGSTVVQILDVDAGAQARTFFDEGLAGQSRFQPSLSLRADYYRSWDSERQSLTVAPFYRYDAQDPERTHFDLREGFWSLVGQNWDLHVGARQIFWGVTEFKHLVDIVNQTDLVENLDGEDKLGAPMVHLSLLRDWGIVDLMLLTGFRERTFAGFDGRPRYYVPVDDDDPVYDSAAENKRVDGVVRWSHSAGAFDFGVYHFSGTSRDPLFNALVRPDGELVLQPRYPVIDQTGLEAQAIVGDWAWKLEAISRSGFGDRYFAYNAGFERTLVGVLGSSADLGLVVEYLYDERGDAAFDTLFEHDIAFGTRWQFNDLSDSQALFGVIWDPEYDEVALSLEASRRLGETWTLMIEGRAFVGDDIDAAMPLAPENKMGSLGNDDYIELELTKFF